MLVDSSVWADFFSSSPGRAGGKLRRMIEDSEPLALTGVVVTEVLQGLTRDAGLLRTLSRRMGHAGAQRASKRTAPRLRIYRMAHGKGISLTTIDTLIAAIALEHKASVFTLDHDFSRIALITGLVLHRF